MRIFRAPETGLSIGLLTCLVVAFTQPVAAQPAGTVKTNGKTLNSRYIPDDALFAMIVSPKEIIASDGMQLFPVEALQIQCQRTFGFAPEQIDEFRVAFFVDPTGRPPTFGVIAKTSGDVSIETLASELGMIPEQTEIEGYVGYKDDNPTDPVLVRIDDRTLYLGVQQHLESIVNAESGDGDLPSIVRTIPDRPGVQLVGTMGPFQDMISGIATQSAPRLTPELQPLAQLPALTDGIKLWFDFDGDNITAEVTIVTSDAEAAVETQTLINNGLQTARRLGVAEFARTLSLSGQPIKMQDAFRSYADRVSRLILERIDPRVDRNEVTIGVDAEIGITTTAMLGGMLVPAVQTARTSAIRASTSNNLNQIMLAFHNYHSAYNQLPLSAITNKDDKPLLSWRVSLLPFMGAQELYNQFDLNQPWDSEVNLPLVKRIPKFYRSPGKNLPLGHTTYQAIVGEDIGLRPLAKTRFQDFLDGLSNSILVVETNDEAAVPWTKPTDLEIDLDNPLKSLGKASNRGFYVAIADGSVRFFDANIDKDLFRKMLTRAGKEVIRMPR